MQRPDDGDIGNREAPGAEIVARFQRGLQHPQPGEEPDPVILHDLRHLPFLRLQVAVAEYQRLREGQRRVAAVQPVEPEGVVRLVRRDPERRRAVAVHEVVADGPGLRHPGVAVDQAGHRAERIDLLVVLVVGAGRKLQRHQLIVEPHLFQRPHAPH